MARHSCPPSRPASTSCATRPAPTWPRPRSSPSRTSSRAGPSSSAPGPGPLRNPLRDQTTTIANANPQPAPTPRLQRHPSRTLPPRSTRLLRTPLPLMSVPCASASTSVPTISRGISAPTKMLAPTSAPAAPRGSTVRMLPLFYVYSPPYLPRPTDGEPIVATSSPAMSRPMIGRTKEPVVP